MSDFFSLYSHDFIRVASCVPRTKVADASYNLAETLRLAALGDKANYVRSIRNSMPMFSPDGKFGGEGPAVALKVLSQFDPDVAKASVDLAATYTDNFIDKAPAQ